MAIEIRDLSKMIDHSLLHPTMGMKELKDGCELAKKYDVASVCVKPYDVLAAKKLLVGTDVKVGSVIGFPHGNSTTAIKVLETKQACLDGAVEIDMVINIGKAIEHDYEYVESEIIAINAEAEKGNAILKVIFENDHLNDEIIITLSEICSAIKVGFIKTSTGYGFVKKPSGDYSYDGATEEDLKSMIKNSYGDVEVKAAGGVRTLVDLLYVKSLGVTRVGCTATEKILENAKEILKSGKTLESCIPDSMNKSEGY